MKALVLNIALFFLLNTSFAQSNQRHFKTEIDFGGGTVISTFLDLNTDKNQFKLTSPKNADVRIVGAKARLGRLLGKLPKKGSIVTIKGAQKADSLFGETAIPMFGKLRFRGAVNNGMLSGELSSIAGTFIGTIDGVISEEDRISYKELYPKIVNTITDNIYSKNALQTIEWKKFEEKLEDLCYNAHDDIELFFGFSMLTPKLPFTHLNLLITQDTADNMGTAIPDKSVVFVEKNTATAYLQIKNFSTSADELEEILP
ncbi:hypothetical protein, partial [Fluviicola sp.]|uniref:hypothetical protein n=1 Tax=Fluviicola sp. TaxID=1917219 RepID=UPI002617E665